VCPVVVEHYDIFAEARPTIPRYVLQDSATTSHRVRLLHVFIVSDEDGRSAWAKIAAELHELTPFGNASGRAIVTEGEVGIVFSVLFEREELAFIGLVWCYFPDGVACAWLD
jgi:hypothetical protein